jgi:hypothetical protein
MAPYIRALYAEHPGLGAPNSDAPHSPRFVQQTVGRAMEDLYHPAQLDVLRRLETLTRTVLGTDRAG